uniref:Uncharacterized protein n=1 Tax=Culex tarsalis TaxID=7177 RepID=A0A1Q3G020_CULTA
MLSRISTGFRRFHIPVRQMSYHQRNGSYITFPATSGVPKTHIYAMGGAMFLAWTIMPHVFCYYIEKYRIALDENQPEE